MKVQRLYVARCIVCLKTPARTRVFIDGRELDLCKDHYNLPLDEILQKVRERVANAEKF